MNITLTEMIRDKTSIMGLSCSQNPLAIYHFGYLFSEIKPKCIIELGTAKGGFSSCLALFSYIRKVKFYTFDVNPNILHKDILELLKAKIITGNIFEGEINNYLLNLLNKVRRPLILLCDNGKKVREVNTFAKYLKIGDIIMAHDYAYDKETYENKIKGKFWNHHEISFEQVKDSLITFEPYMQEMFNESVWMCMKKIK